MGDHSECLILSSSKAYTSYQLLTNKVFPESVIKYTCDIMINFVFGGYKGFWLSLPQSTSFLKVVNVPWFVSPINTDVTNKAEDIALALQNSTVVADTFHILVHSMHFFQTSLHSSEGTAYFEIWDSKSGAHAKCIMGCTFMF
jgi:hypothetical protein